MATRRNISALRTIDSKTPFSNNHIIAIGRDRRTQIVIGPGVIDCAQRRGAVARSPV